MIIPKNTFVVELYLANFRLGVKLFYSSKLSLTNFSQGRYQKQVTKVLRLKELFIAETNKRNKRVLFSALLICPMSTVFEETI